MKKNEIKGFSYQIEKEKLIAYSKLSIEDKLRWLEEINEFTRLAETKEAANIRARFKDKSFKESGYDDMSLFS